MLYRKLGSEKVGGRANKNRSFLFSSPLMIMSLILFFYFGIRSVSAFLLNKFVGFFCFNFTWRPMEMSSKKPVTRFREIIQVPKKVRSHLTRLLITHGIFVVILLCMLVATDQHKFLLKTVVCLEVLFTYSSLSLCLFPSILLKCWGLKSA